MAFSNMKSILSGNVGVDTVKLLLLQAGYSRPVLRPLTETLLRPFYHQDEMTVRYTFSGRDCRALIRKEQQESDFYSVMELGIRRVYQLDPALMPDVVIDGGGNIGLFTMLAAAVYPKAKIITCEPVPANIAQIKKHEKLNGTVYELRPSCIGGSRGSITFYCREANQGSFDPGKPYDSQMVVDVFPLSEIVPPDAQRILIKLDIEGMEIEALESYLPTERRAVYVLGELHGHKENHAALERIFASQGWSLRFSDVSDAGSVFAGWSPAADAFLNASAAG